MRLIQAEEQTACEDGLRIKYVGNWELDKPITIGAKIMPVNVRVTCAPRVWRSNEIRAHARFGECLGETLAGWRSGCAKI